MRTNKELITLLRDAFRDAKVSIDEEGDVYYLLDEDECDEHYPGAYGLCDFVDDMYGLEEVDDDEYVRITDILHQHRPVDASSFWFPIEYSDGVDPFQIRLDFLNSIIEEL